MNDQQVQLTREDVRNALGDLYLDVIAKDMLIRQLQSQLRGQNESVTFPVRDVEGEQDLPRLLQGLGREES
jgi:hypothetical protein